jgi:hypothetical protein
MQQFNHALNAEDNSRSPVEMLPAGREERLEPTARFERATWALQVPCSAN